MNNEPSHEDWLKLFEAALKFKEIEAWNWMYDDYLFGVQNPEDSVIGYCSVLGELGEVFGLIVYTGQSGLESYTTIVSNPEDIHDNMFIQDCISATFNDRKYLDRNDISLIKKLGLKFRGRDAYPQFRRLKPNYVPWYLTKKECKFLTTALEQAVNVCLRARDDERLLKEPLKNGDCLIRYFDNDGWKDRLQMLDTTKREKVVSIQANELKLAAIKKNSVKSYGKWEIDFFVNSTMPIKDKESPYFPLVTLIADLSSGQIFNVHLTEPSDYHQRIFDNFVEFIEKTEVIPQEIFVEKSEMKSILHPATDALGIELTKVKKCMMVKETQKGLLKFASRGHRE